MINFDDYVNGIAFNENKTEHNKNWPYIPDHPYRILIIGGSNSGKTNLSLNLIENQPDIDKIYLYVKDSYESKTILMLLLIIQTICMMFKKILMITILIKKIKY